MSVTYVEVERQDIYDNTEDGNLLYILYIFNCLSKNACILLYFDLDLAFVNHWINLYLIS